VALEGWGLGTLSIPAGGLTRFESTSTQEVETRDRLGQTLGQRPHESGGGMHLEERS
jgi:hypothetical protein